MIKVYEISQIEKTGVGDGTVKAAAGGTKNFFLGTVTDGVVVSAPTTGLGIKLIANYGRGDDIYKNFVTPAGELVTAWDVSAWKGKCLADYAVVGDEAARDSADLGYSPLLKEHHVHDECHDYSHKRRRNHGVPLLRVDYHYQHNQSAEHYRPPVGIKVSGAAEIGAYLRYLVLAHRMSAEEIVDLTQRDDYSDTRGESGDDRSGQVAYELTDPANRRDNEYRA